MNCVHFWTLKYVDNAPPLLKGTHKFLLGIQHGNRKLIINNSGNSISVKLSLVSLATGVDCNSHVGDML